MSDPIMSREQLGDKLARAIAPESWKEYDAGDGVCSNMAGWACLESIRAAARILDMLHEEGYPVAASKRNPEQSSGQCE